MLYHETALQLHADTRVNRTRPHEHTRPFLSHGTPWLKKDRALEKEYERKKLLPVTRYSVTGEKKLVPKNGTIQVHPREGKKPLSGSPVKQTDED